MELTPINYRKDRKGKEDNLNDFFTQVTVIVLPERKEYINSVLNKMGVSSFKEFDAILGKTLNRDLLIESKQITKGCALRINEIACALSHLKAIQDFYNNSSEGDTLFIFEDDIEYNPDYMTPLKAVLDTVPKDWDFLQFGHCWDNCLNMKPVKGGNRDDNSDGNSDGNSNSNSDSSIPLKTDSLDQKTSLIFKTDNPLCSHSYAITRRCAEIILNKAFPISKPIDVFYIELSKMKNEKMNLYTIHPRIFTQMKGSLVSKLTNKNGNIFASTLDNNDTCFECQHQILNVFENNTIQNFYIGIIVLFLFSAITFVIYKVFYSKK